MMLDRCVIVYFNLMSSVINILSNKWKLTFLSEIKLKKCYGPTYHMLCYPGTYDYDYEIELFEHI